MRLMGELSKNDAGLVCGRARPTSFGEYGLGSPTAGASIYVPRPGDGRGDETTRRPPTGWVLC